jgi:hypothetical protein
VSEAVVAARDRVDLLTELRLLIELMSHNPGMPEAIIQQVDRVLGRDRKLFEVTPALEVKPEPEVTPEPEITPEPEMEVEESDDKPKRGRSRGGAKW